MCLSPPTLCATLLKVLNTFRREISFKYLFTLIEIHECFSVFVGRSCCHRRRSLFQVFHRLVVLDREQLMVNHPFLELNLECIPFVPYFRLNHPIEVKKRKKEIKQGGGTEGINPESVGTKDFEFARNELAQAQNARLVV